MMMIKKKPPADWFARLPRERLIAEFSVWSADLLRIGGELERIRPHADMLHIDVADGHFSPALLFFPDLVARVRAASDLPLHVHLMVDEAIVESQIDQFAEAGADLISLHVDSRAGVDPMLARIRQHGLLAGLVLQVETPVTELMNFIDRVDVVTLLGTSIGVKGKGLHEAALSRMAQARALLQGADLGHRVVLAADGGIRLDTVPALRAAGAEAVVLGSLAFGAPDLDGRMAWLAAQ